MEKKSSLPTQAELAAFIKHLEGTADVPSEGARELNATERGDLAGDLLVRLEQGVAEMKADGEPIPPALMRTIELLRAHNDFQTEGIDPHEWIKSLLAGQIPGGRVNSSAGLSFRSLTTDVLTEEDREILREMADEVRAKKEKNE